MNFSLNFIRVSYGINTFSYLKYNIIYQISRRYIEYHIHFPIKIYLESKLKNVYLPTTFNTYVNIPHCFNSFS